MRCAYAIVLAACSGPPPSRSQSVHTEPVCTIRETALDLDAPVRLRNLGLQFAAIAGPYDVLEVAVTAKDTRVRVETKDLVLEGDVTLDELSLRPRTMELHDGWVRIHSVKPRRVTGQTVHLDVALPDGITPSSLQMTLPCAELTAAAPPELSVAPPMQWVVFVGGSTPLSTSPDGGPVATITSEPPEDRWSGLHAVVLARSGGTVRVRLDDSSSFRRSNVAEGWVAAAATRTADDPRLYGGLLGDETPITILRCTRPVPVFVNAGWQTVRVGYYKPGGELRAIGDRSQDEVTVELGHFRAHPFVRRADLAACVE